MAQHSDFFSYAGYSSWLHHLKSFGPVLRLQDLCQETKHGTLLRHDVDCDPEPALRLSKIEESCGVRSTFFFLVTCPLYNVFSPLNRAAIRSIADRGFEVGLHFDPTVYGTIDADGLDRAAHAEAGLLAQIAGRPVTSVSLHNPSVNNEFPMIAGMNNAYDRSIFDDLCYMADSRREFRGKDPWAFANLAQERLIQVLTHPFHFSPSGCGYKRLLLTELQSYAKQMHEYFHLNSAYREAFPSSIATLVTVESSAA